MTDNFHLLTEPTSPNTTRETTTEVGRVHVISALALWVRS